MNVLRVLRTLEEVELRMARLYRWMSESFADDEEAPGFFFKMSIQERSHANLLRYGRKLATNNPDEFADTDVDLQPVDDLLEEIDRFCNGSSMPSVEDALRFAVQLESHPLENIHRAVLVTANPDVANMINSLANADEEHIKVLESFASSRQVEG